MSRPRNTELEADGSIVADLWLFWAHGAQTWSKALRLAQRVNERNRCLHQLRYS